MERTTARTNHDGRTRHTVAPLARGAPLRADEHPETDDVHRGRPGEIDDDPHGGRPPSPARPADPRRSLGYTGLDAVAGIAAGTVAGQPGNPADLRRLVLALYDTGDRLGHAGVYAFLAAVLAAAAVLGGRHGLRVLPGTVVLLGAGYSFIDSHIFRPRGVLTMLAIAAGFALWIWATTKHRRRRPFSQ